METKGLMGVHKYHGKSAVFVVNYGQTYRKIGHSRTHVSDFSHVAYTSVHKVFETSWATPAVIFSGASSIIVPEILASAVATKIGERHVS